MIHNIIEPPLNIGTMLDFYQEMTSNSTMAHDWPTVGAIRERESVEDERLILNESILLFDLRKMTPIEQDILMAIYKRREIE